MLNRDYEGQNCSIARALEVVGERWTLLIIRDLLLGLHRFDELQESLGIARNVLTDRLNRLVEEGIFERVAYQDHPVRFEYQLTPKGIDLWPVVVSLLQWGDKYVYPGRAPLLLVHKRCGGEVDSHRMCERCGVRLGPRDVEARQGIAGGVGVAS